MKKITYILFILVLTIIIITVSSAELSNMQKPIWKQGSAASLAWDAYNGADYYDVEVCVYHNGSIVGSTKTGTAETTIDVQQEIRNIVGYAEYDLVSVIGRITANRTNNNGSLIPIAISEYSDSMNYSLVTSIGAPKNLYIDPSTYNLTFDVVEGAVSYELVWNGGGYGGGGYELVVKNGKVTGNIAEYLKSWYYYDNHAGETIDVYVCAIAYNSVGETSRLSKPSNTVSFYEESPIVAPKNLYINPETYDLSFDAVEGAVSYELVWNGGGYGGGGYELIEKNGKVTGNIAEYLKSWYYYDNHAGETIDVYVCAKAYNSEGLNSTLSKPSNTVSFYEDPPVAAPKNLYINPETYDLSFDAVEGAVSYELVWNGGGYGGGGYELIEKNGKVTGNIAEYLKSWYYYDNHAGETIDVYVCIKAYNSEGLNSTLSKPSNTISFSDYVQVEAINISPKDPILYIGNSLYLGKTILPEKAYYTSIDWKSDDDAVVTVNNAGKITGIKKGKTNITASIGKVSRVVTVNVYEVDTNIEDEADQQEVTDTAGSIIDDIGNNDTPNIECTDLLHSEVADKKIEIHQGIENGDSFRSDIVLSNKKKEDFNQYWDKIQAISENGKFAGGFDIDIEVYHQDQKGSKHHIVNITEFDKEIGFTVNGDSLPEVEAGKYRKYTLVRIHNGTVDTIDVSEKGNNQFASKSNQFSEFVLMYKDINESADKVEAFVTRCYQIILGRQPDAGGMKTWYNELISGRRAASEIIDCFVRSQEFLGKNYSNADSVEILYKAMLGRGSDPAGKATWVGKLDAGHPFAVVINGFCGSKEFKEICDAYGITPGSVSMEQGSESDQQIRAFVTRCYKIILGRDPDGEGMNTWFNELKSRRRAAAEIIEQFVYSQEFQNKKYSNPDAVEILYKAMLGRGSDPAGKADWVAKLNNGQPLTAIINGFCGSMEFGAICDAYGITPGSVQVQQLSSQPVVEEDPAAKQTVTKTENNITKVEIVNPSDTENAQLGTAVQAIYINEEKAKVFIGRCYKCILGREASQAELDSWIGQMLNGTKTADQIARGFLFSGEFKDKNVSNDELVKILYRVYLNREADAEGLATWTQKLDEGTSLQALLDAFAKTNEFKAVIRNMAQ